MRIGVLALQGAFIEHIKILKRISVQTSEVRLKKDLEGLDGLIIPGGESTTIGKLAKMYDLIAPIMDFSKTNPVWGTCAGMILMAKEIKGEQPILGIMDIIVERNAFGRQVDSFEEKLYIDKLIDSKIKPFPAIFIRAPKLINAGNNAQIIARLADGTAVAAIQNKLLATAFHPELSDDDRFHRFFINLVQNQAS